MNRKKIIAHPSGVLESIQHAISLLGQKYAKIAMVCCGLLLHPSCYAYEHGHWGSHGRNVYVAPAFPAWGGPNVVINVPVGPIVPPVPYYAPQCESVQVCNQYRECWLEERCR